MPTGLASVQSPGVRDLRFHVMGSTGSGKTTLARQLSGCLGIPHIELDALNWGPQWTPAPVDTFRQKTLEAVRQTSWVVDGNYHVVREIVWPRASTVVYLDYPLRTVLFQLLTRIFRRALTREVLWNGNRERLATHFLSRDSLLLYLFKSYWRHRREYLEAFKLPEYSHLAIVRLTSHRESKRWLDSVARGHLTANRSSRTEGTGLPT